MFVIIGKTRLKRLLLPQRLLQIFKKRLLISR